MKAILEFDLPDDEYEYKAATKGKDYLFALWDLDQWLRSQMKYHDHLMTEEEYNAYEKCRNKLHEVMQDHNVSFDE